MVDLFPEELRNVHSGNNAPVNAAPLPATNKSSDVWEGWDDWNQEEQEHVDSDEDVDLSAMGF
jgi:hypothetical protein